MIEFVLSNTRPYDGYPQTILYNGIDRFTGCDRGWYAQQGCEIMHKEEYAVFQAAYLASLCGKWTEKAEV